MNDRDHVSVNERRTAQRRTAAMRPETLGTLLAVWAHPDDESYLAAGTMAMAARAGQRVVCVSATAGEHGTADPVGNPPEVLAAVRRAEARAAMDVLGIDDHRFLGYEDGTLAAIDASEPVARVAQLIEEVRPDTILTFGPDGMTFHRDHQAVSAWVGAAWAATGRPGRLLHTAWARSHLREWGALYERWGIWMTAERRPTGFADHELDLDVWLPDDVVDLKVAALEAMPSQTADAIALIGRDAYRADNARESFVLAHRHGRPPHPPASCSANP